MPDSFEIVLGSGTLIATAIHDGSRLREDLKSHINLNKLERLREEDPFTAEWVEIADNQVIAFDTRFEVDLNRPRDKAIYLKPEDAWGLKVWKEELSPDQINYSLKKYDHFYRDVQIFMDQIKQKFGGVVVYDLHTYNHRRDGQDAPAASPEENPEVNVGTGNMNRKKWAPLVENFMETLSSFDYQGRNLDVRENVKFKGGHFSGWIHQTFPDVSCVLSIEVKKFFMDEWTGIPDKHQLNLVKEALRSTVPGVLNNFQKIIR
ncbi:N-formylglutamate amidohydrolase [soil metagenome]